MGYRGRNIEENVKDFVPKSIGRFWEEAKRMFWDDWRTKLFALLFALSLWFFLLSERLM
jgi:hypothetical protein